MHSNKRARMEEQKLLFMNPIHLVALNNARLSEKLCDVTIKVNDKEFHAHKIILAMNLKYFEKMFLNSCQEIKKDVITMQDVKESDIEALITYAYTGNIFITENNVLNLFELANHLIEDSIKEACVNFLKIHLKKEDACSAYKLANSTECSALKNIAKQVILSNFENCSLTAEYLSLDFESLNEILSSASTFFVQSQQVFFEGIVRWILHDAERRRPHVDDVLNQIEITKLRPDYLLHYCCEWIKDQCDIVKDIMTFYYTKTQQISQTESLMMIGRNNNQVHLQSYNFTENKWGLPRLVKEKVFENGIIFNNMFFYTTYDNLGRVDFQVFNPMTMQTTMLTSDTRMLKWSGVCAGTNKIYFCGGHKENGSASNQVLSYDPQMNCFEKLPHMKMKRWSPSVILHQDCLFVLGGNNGSTILNSVRNLVEKYDLNNMDWTASAPMCEQHCGHAVAVLEGKLYACRSAHTGVQVYDFLKNSWELVASMNKMRSSFPLVAHKGKLLAIGGDNERTVEVYDPIKDHWQMDVEMSLGLQILFPRGGFIPTSCVIDHI